MEAGHAVTATLRQPIERYEGLRGERVSLLQSLGVRLVEKCSFGDVTFLELLGQGTEALCHHAASVENYKSLDFDFQQALRDNTLNLRSVIQVSRQSSIQGIVLTGSVFEQDEGAGDSCSRAFSPYGLSKGLTWQVFRFWCESSQLPLHKFVIPNPFGPYEEPRFCSFLVNKWVKKETPQINTPDYVRDNIPVSLLAKSYAHFVEKTLRSQSWSVLHPSFYVETQGAFASRFAKEIGARLNILTPLSFGVQTDFSEPMVRINYDRLNPETVGWSEGGFWDEVAAYYGTRLEILGENRSE